MTPRQTLKAKVQVRPRRACDRIRRISLTGVVSLAVVGAFALFGHGQGWAQSATIKVCWTCKYTTIQGAIDAASSGDTIQIAPGTYSGPISIDLSLNLVSTGSDRTKIITPIYFRAPLVTITGSAVSVSITGLTITGNQVVGDGGGIDNEGATVTLNRSVVSFDQATYGGGIYNGIGVMTINDSSVSGSAVWGTVTYGGGIYNQAGTLTLNKSVISGAAVYGGGIYNDLGTVALNDSHVVDANDFTGGGGGGIYNNDGTLTLTKSTVRGNISDVAGGGGIYSDAGTVTLNNSPVSHNTSPSRGGGVYVGGGTLMLNNSPLEANSATDGGGIYVFDGAVVTLNKSHVIHNSATDRGGGIYDTGTLTLIDSSVSHNKPDNCAPTACSA